jgi:dinuclear metal center YbgI/SA1388 family protein
MLKDIISYLEQLFPLAFQESYDNAGLITGSPEAYVTGVLILTDVTEQVLDEAIEKKCNLIISHHPLIFSGLKTITGKNYVERLIIKAIKNDIALYACHTNADSMSGGVNSVICEKIGLINTSFLIPAKDVLSKVVVFVPVDYAGKVRKAMFDAGAGTIGGYDSCSFNLNGEGTFRANDHANPFVGKKGKLHTENETRIETIVPQHLVADVINAIINVHPYEEPAYDIYPLKNSCKKAGIGMVGELKKEMDEKSFLEKLKKTFHCQVIRHTALLNKKVRRVAVCGGAGSQFLQAAIAKKAHFYVSADYKYHQFFDADNKIVIADIGHYESEHCTEQLFYEIITKKFANFAVHLSEQNTNPIKYFK